MPIQTKTPDHFDFQSCRKYPTITEEEFNAINWNVYVIVDKLDRDLVVEKEEKMQNIRSSKHTHCSSKCFNLPSRNRYFSQPTHIYFSQPVTEEEFNAINWNVYVIVDKLDRDLVVEKEKMQNIRSSKHKHCSSKCFNLPSRNRYFSQPTHRYFSQPKRSLMSAMPQPKTTRKSDTLVFDKQKRPYTASGIYEFDE